jgi:S-DNA-T family DNA segregation ATPase FtsK/SpoIIIE
MRQRADRLRGITRQHTATITDPTIVVLVDELAALTAYVTDRKPRSGSATRCPRCLAGRAVGVHVVAALQDPRKEVLRSATCSPPGSDYG